MDADAVAVSGVWSPSCAKSSPPRSTGSPPCANATAVTLVLAHCPHFQLENAPRDMPLFGLLSASVLLTVGLIANGMVISFQLRRRRRRLPRSPATATAAARDPGVLHPTLAPPLPFVTVLALADLLGCGVVFTSHIAYSLAVSSSPAPRATPVIYMVFMGTVTWLGLVETLIIGAMASQRVYSVMYPQRPLPGSGWVKAVFVVVGIGGLMALPPGGGLWCDISQWTLSTMWACPDCQDFFRSLLDCRVFTFFYCILTLTVIISSCLSYAALSIFSRVHTGAAKPEPVVSNGPKPNTGNNPKPVKMFGIVFADTVCTTICWTPFLVQSLINQEHSATAGPVHAACTLDSTFPQIALVPMLLHPADLHPGLRRGLGLLPQFLVQEAAPARRPHQHLRVALRRAGAQLPGAPHPLHSGPGSGLHPPVGRGREQWGRTAVLRQAQRLLRHRTLQPSALLLRRSLARVQGQ
ncbi:uncharacterized protein LOC129602702 [Paramacrobiotus metropolitanus]|uniref:uncharacterized protein LOC129602702 n=1 Tax=Paramacrobiotus metropolitanus TaxID=2943436 RepID=UPI0024462E0B|nr:uncharacterized protein LOC129602702 [Paramacrobiotus metropolitanus]